ncbi:MAG: hypothetical protein JWM87_4117 [Candidatus Eremiobacteraeota bacterium]|nr:hypothetical protein [Candidatus Eremiobacteraeota bacterium]
MPIMHTHAAIEEAQSLGKAPFALVVHASGALGGRPGYRRGDTTASGEVGCPASGSFHFVIHTAGTTADRFIPCRITLAATGPIGLATWPPASVAPLPTPCSSGACAPAVLPTPPSSNPSCPPNYAPAQGGCTPAPPGSGPRYHVSASLASATMSVGGSDDSIIAKADLTNANAVPAGTPLSLPVLIQRVTDPICTATPTGPQPSASTFTLKAISPGTCTVTIGADSSAVPGATADNVTFNVPVSAAAPTPTPTPLSCDRKKNGLCYHQIVDAVSQTFWKYVVPDYACDTGDNGNECHYINSIKEIYIGPGYGVQPIGPPTDNSHELLFEVQSLRTVFNSCQPFTFIASFPVNIPIPWGGYGIGSPTDATIGFGEPSVFSTINHVTTGSLPNGDFTEPDMIWQQPTTLSAMYNAVAQRLVGTPYTFSYSSASSTMQSVVWYPDFAGCDALGDAVFGTEFGNAGVQIVFSIFQALGSEQ